VVHVELTAAGDRLVAKIRSGQIEVCRAMLARLNARDREDLIRIVKQLGGE
jgi:DNA-binding MarR family transcriptional regulator